jgi:hypothetical protein
LIKIVNKLRSLRLKQYVFLFIWLYYQICETWFKNRSRRDFFLHFALTNKLILIKFILRRCAMYENVDGNQLNTFKIYRINAIY